VSLARDTCISEHAYYHTSRLVLMQLVHDLQFSYSMVYLSVICSVSVIFDLMILIERNHHADSAASVNQNIYDNILQTLDIHERTFSVERSKPIVDSVLLLFISIVILIFLYQRLTFSCEICPLL
jgi:ABC-type xylose transport system permease subunit